jgi:hypothetical protein
MAALGAVASKVEDVDEVPRAVCFVFCEVSARPLVVLVLPVAD